MSILTDQVLVALPQTQCEECGYKGCRPYAEAVVNGEDIDLCAPGGEPVHQALQAITGRVGDSQKVLDRFVLPSKAVIDQSVCIGCTKCIKPCPTAAIVGYQKMNHFVVAVDCTGCGLCVDYCPVDCITLEHDDLSHKGALSLAHEYQSLYEKKKITDLEKSLEVKQKKDILKDIDDILSGL